MSWNFCRCHKKYDINLPTVKKKNVELIHNHLFISNEHIYFCDEKYSVHINEFLSRKE